MANQIVDFDVPRREFILHNPSIDRVELQYDGETKYLPPRDVVVQPSPHHPHAFASGRDADGDFIPGTLAFQDIYEQTSEGERLVWDAGQAIRNLLGIDKNTRVASGVFARRGVSMIPNRATKAEIAQITEAGRQRYEEFQIENARAIIAAHEEANKARARRGHNELPGGREYEDALLLIQTAVARQRERVESIFKRSDVEHGYLNPPPETEEVKPPKLRIELAG